MVWEYLAFKNIELRLHKCLGSKVKRQRRVHNRFSPGLPSLHSTLDTKCWLFPDKSKIETISKLKKSDTLLTKHNDYNGDVLSQQLLIDDAEQWGSIIGALNVWIMISFCQEMAFLAVFKQGSSGKVECTSASLCLCWADSRFLAGKRKWVGP